MPVVEFNGSTGEIRTSKGTWVATGALTIAALVKRMSNATWDAILAPHTTGNAGTCGLEITDNSGAAGTYLNRLSYFAGGSGGAGLTANAEVLTTTGWCIVVVRKAAGSNTALFHRFPLSTATWAAATADTVSPNAAATTGGTIRFGLYEGVDPAAIRLALAAVWDSQLSQAQAEALATGLSTAAWTGHAVAPKEVWEFTSAASISSLTGGGANQTARTGTSVVTGDDPPGWTFSGGGGALPAKNLAALGVG